jgi:hypothetical protein
MTTTSPTDLPAEGSASPPTAGAERAAAGTADVVDPLGWVTGLVRGDRHTDVHPLTLGRSAERMAAS